MLSTRGDIKMNIIVNNEIVSFSHEDLPMFISGAEKSGTSFFSICLMAELFKSGEKVVIFTAYPEAKEKFRKQVGDKINENAKIIDSGDEDVFLEVINKIEDLEKRIVLVKNIENYSENLFNKLKNKNLIIFSGDIDKCPFGDGLAKKDFKTKIFFSYPKKIMVENKIELPKYNGLIVNEKYNGLVSLDMKL
jgi:hypothetical protein